MLYYTVVCGGEMDDVKVNCDSLNDVRGTCPNDVFERVGEVMLA